MSVPDSGPGLSVGFRLLMSIRRNLLIIHTGFLQTLLWLFDSVVLWLIIVGHASDLPDLRSTEPGLSSSLYDYFSFACSLISITCTSPRSPSVFWVLWYVHRELCLGPWVAVCFPCFIWLCTLNITYCIWAHVSMFHVIGPADTWQIKGSVLKCINLIHFLTLY